MLSVVCWKWARPDGSSPFSARHVNVLRAMLNRHLHLEHELVCVTDDPTGLNDDIRPIAMSETYTSTPRCRRRMQQWSREFGRALGEARMLAIDLDVVLVDDITPLVAVAAPIVAWKVGHAGVYSGSFLVADVGALHGAWEAFRDDPDGYPTRASPVGVGSDQAMLNLWLREHPQPAMWEWRERAGLVSFYGAGYERLEHLGVGPNRRDLPSGARIVVLGSADMDVLEDASYPWVRDYYLPLMAAQGVA